MKNLKNPSAAFVLTLVLGLAVFAGEMPTAPCAPGEMQTPPCASGLAANPGDMGTPTVSPTAPGQLETPPEASFTEIATDVLYSILSLF